MALCVTGCTHRPGDSTISTGAALLQILYSDDDNDDFVDAIF